MTVLSSIAREPSFTEMLSDPIVQTIMDRDEVTRRNLEDLIESVRDRSLVRRRNEQETICQQLRAVASGG